MHSRRTRGWYLTRIEFATAFLLPGAVALLWLSAPQSVGPPMFDGAMPWVGPVILGIGAALWLIGLLWMIRVYRGPRDEPPPWRYRDR